MADRERLVQATRGAAFRVTLWLVVMLSGCVGEHRTTPEGDDVRVVAGSIDAAKLLDGVAASARQAGAGELTPVGARILFDGEQLGSFVEVPPADCVLVVARGGKSVSDIDLFVYSDGGDRLASDEAPESRAAVMVCPPHPRRVYVVLRTVAGEGMVALGVMQVAAQHADAVAKAVEVRGRPGQDTGKLAQWPGLERMVRERRASLGSRWEDVRRVALPLSPRASTSVSVTIEPERCVDVLIVPSDEIQGMDAVVVDESGRAVARGKPPGKTRAFVLCTREAAQVVTVMVRPRVASGLAAVVIGQSERGAAAEIADKAWVWAPRPLLDVAAATRQHDARVAPLRFAAPEELAQGELVVGAPQAWSVELGAGCSRLDVVGGSPLGGLLAELWTIDGRPLSSQRGGSVTTLFSCGGPRKARLELTALDRGGAVVVESRRDEQPPNAMVLHPLAGGRLLERLDAMAGPVDADDGDATVVLEASAVLSPAPPLSLKAGQCVDVVAALDARGEGLSLVASLDGAAPRTSRGRAVTGQRVCAGESAKRVTLAVQIASGSGPVLLLARPS